MNRPDKWVVIKIQDKDNEPHYKVFASWMGGYTQGDYWQMNSGVVKVIDGGGYYDFIGESGSTYTCHKKAYGTGTAWTTQVLTNIINKASERGVTITILPEDTDWLNLI